MLQNRFIKGGFSFCKTYFCSRCKEHGILKKFHMVTDDKWSVATTGSSLHGSRHLNLFQKHLATNNQL
jgi:hypothetical protein